MSDRTPSENIKFVLGVKPDAHTVGTVSGTVIDTLGYEYASFYVMYGTANTSVDFKVNESDAAASGFADVTSGAITQMTTGDEEAILQVDLRKRKRYITPVLTLGGTEDAAVSCILSNYKYVAVTQTADETVTV